MTDNYEHKGLRQQLINIIKLKGIKSQKVLDAIGNIPRHLFVDSSLYRMAYEDKAMRIGHEQTISQPYTVACQTELLDIQKFDKVLEVGTGSGYQAAVLAEMGARVYTIERIHPLFLKAQRLLSQLKYKIHFVYGDGYAGLPTYGPYNKIIVTAGAPDIPEKLIGQLKEGGKMVVPVDKFDFQEMFLIEKTGPLDTDIIITKHGKFQFVPMLKGKQQ